MAKLVTVSNMGISMAPPSPLTDRWYSAAAMLKAANSPATLSATPLPVYWGWPPTQACWAAIPEAAWMTSS